MQVDELVLKAAELRLKVLRAIYKAGSGHAVSMMSVVEILTTLYYGELGGRKVVSIDPAKPGSPDQDYVVLCKNHAVPLQYAILADLDFFDKSELDYLGMENALLKTRPSVKIPGITFTNNTVTHGLSQAVGLAMALKMDRKLNKVFAVIGDAQLQSGQVWEAILSAAHYKLDNLVVFVDDNKLQRDGHGRGVMDVDSIQTKFDAFNWRVFRVLNGNDFDQILDTLARTYTVTRRPICIWCNTVSGQGLEFAEGKSGYHGVSLSEGEYGVATAQLEEKLKELSQ